MAQVGLLVGELKRYLKAQGVTYAQLAARVGLSESSIKRLFASQTFTLQRLEEICNKVGLEIGDLVELMNERREFLTQLTPEQEEALLADTKLLLMTYLLINGWPLPEIVASFTIEWTKRRGSDPAAPREDHRALPLIAKAPHGPQLRGANRPCGSSDAGAARLLAGPFVGAGAEFQFVGGMLSLTASRRCSSRSSASRGVRRARAARRGAAARRPARVRRRVRDPAVGVLAVRRAAPKKIGTCWIFSHGPNLVPPPKIQHVPVF
jgi:DNA-binding Xre family transcriptional regulator